MEHGSREIASLSASAACSPTADVTGSRTPEKLGGTKALALLS